MTASTEARDTALWAAQAAADKLATDVSIVDVSDRLAITDAFVLASAPSERQVQAIVDGVEEALREHGLKPVRREGVAEARWVLLDFVDVVVHVQHAEERAYYSLERLWKDCPTIPFTDSALAAAGRTPAAAAPVTGDVTVDGVTDDVALDDVALGDVALEDVAPGDEAGDVVSGGVSGEGESAEAALDPATAHAPEADTTR